MPNLFLVTSRYLVSIEEIEPHRADHLAWIKEQVEKGHVLLGGPRVPRDGAVIIVKVSSKEEAIRLFENDPYAVRKLAKYDVAEFKVVVANGMFTSYLS